MERVTYSEGSLLIILLLRTAVLLVSATDRICGADQKDRSSGDKNGCVLESGL